MSDGNTSISIDRNLQIAQEIIGSNLKGMSVHSFVTNRLPLLDLPDDIVAAIEDRLLYTKAFAISKVDDVEVRADLIKTVGDENYSLLEVKKEVNKLIKGLELIDGIESETDDSKPSPDLKVQKTRLTSILRQVKSMKRFERLDELNDLLDRIEAGQPHTFRNNYQDLGGDNV